eukprot:gene21776-28795_t
MNSRSGSPEPGGSKARREKNTEDRADSYLGTQAKTRMGFWEVWASLGKWERRGAVVGAGLITLTAVSLLDSKYVYVIVTRPLSWSDLTLFMLGFSMQLDSKLTLCVSGFSVQFDSHYLRVKEWEIYWESETDELLSPLGKSFCVLVKFFDQILHRLSASVQKSKERSPNLRLNEFLSGRHCLPYQIAFAELFTGRNSAVS